MKQKLFALSFCLLFSVRAFAKEELTVIQTVARDRRSFVVGKGIKDGVLKNQEIIFANQNVSIVCKAIEVNRNFSMWVPVDRNITVPFYKEEIISSNSVVYGNVALEVAGDPGLVPSENINEIYKKFRLQDNITAKIGYDKALSQSTSSVSEDTNTSSVGFSLAAEYNNRLMPEFEMTYGIRYDHDVFTIEDQNLDVPVKRVMGTIGATYHFVNFSSSKQNVYLTIAAGIGKSTTDVNGEKSSGLVKLLPEARVGYIMPFSRSTAMIFEAAVESLSSTESFDDGTEQTTNVVNLKGSIGLRF
jgi:hypothetical protein